MLYMRIFWFITNIGLILIILIRNPNEQSLQELFGSLQLFDSPSDTEKKLDKLIVFLIVFYFIFGILFATKKYV